jgi:hypothetical protein
MRRIRPGHRFGCAVALALGVVGAAHAESDAQVYEQAIERAARVCPGHATDRTTPGVKAIKVDALRVLAKRDVTLCPDRRLEAATPVVWYGSASVFAWNPTATGAVAVLTIKVDAMTRKEDFPAETLVWNADGSEAKGVTVPAFELRPIPASRY